MKPGNHSLGKKRTRKIVFAVLAVCIAVLLGVGLW